MSNLQVEIYKALLQIPVIDTHEHLMYDEASEFPCFNDVLQLYLWHYMKSDLLSAGLSTADLAAAVSPEKEIVERWQLIEPYWEACRFTGYARALDIAVQKIYGISKIDGKTIEAVSQAFKENNHSGHSARVLQNLCGIETSCVDLGAAVMQEANPLFHNVWQPSAFITPNAEQWQEVLRTDSLENWCEKVKRAVVEALFQNKSKLLKLAFAYERSLAVDLVERQTAQKLFVAAHQQKECGFVKPLQDYMIHFVLQTAAEMRLTVQIHTGHLEGTFTDVTPSDPALLIPLFMQYPAVKFDVFHIGFPFENKLISICKSFPNVFVDMCWAHILSPVAAREFLFAFLQCVPYTKLSVFGGDYFFVDGVCGHLELCRQNVASVLAQCIEQNVMTKAEALKVARAIFYENPKQILQLI